jgi:hypothetical protein
MKGHGWQGFDDLLRFDDDLLTIFAASQTREIYQDKDIVLSFVATPNNTAFVLEVLLGTKDKSLINNTKNNTPALRNTTTIVWNITWARKLQKYSLTWKRLIYLSNTKTDWSLIGARAHKRGCKEK